MISSKAFCRCQRSSAGQCKESLTTCLLTLTAKGALAAILWAKVLASPRASPGKVSRLTKPHWRASSADIMSPVRAYCMAICRGMRCGKRSKPPEPAIKPRLTSGKPNCALSAATIRSQASAISKPPAKAKPSTAAITGFLGGVSMMPPRPRPGSSMRSPFTNALRSMPEQKCPPSPVKMPTVTVSSLSSRSMASAKACEVARSIALRMAGRQSVMTSSLPSCTTRTVGSALMVQPFVSGLSNPTCHESHDQTLSVRFAHARCHWC